MSVDNKKDKTLKSIVKSDGTNKRFDEIAISTKTVIGISNLKINLDKFYHYMPITDYTPPLKKRGRKRRIQISTTSNNIPFGSIISIQRKKEIRGAILKTKKKSSDKSDDEGTPRTGNEKDYFLHSVSLVVVLEDNKQINIKVSSNGKLQITGCKCDDHFIQAVISVYKTMIEVEKWTGETLFTLNGDLEVVFNTVMQNMDFNVGFRINRYKLDKYINQYTNYCSIFEGSLSTGVNIKVKSDPSVHPKILKIRYSNGELERFYTSFEEYKTLLDKKKERKYIPGNIYYSPYSYYYNHFWGYRSTLYNRIHEPGYYVTDTKYFWESNLYDMDTQKLVYSVQTQSFEPSNSETMGHEYGQMMVKHMIKNNLFNNNKR